MLIVEAANSEVSFYIDGKMNNLLSNVVVRMIDGINKITDVLENPNSNPLDVKIYNIAIAKGVADLFKYDRKLNNEPINSDIITIDVKNFIQGVVYNIANYVDLNINKITDYAFKLFMFRFGPVYYNIYTDPMEMINSFFNKQELEYFYEKEYVVRNVSRNIKEAILFK